LVSHARVTLIDVSLRDGIQSERALVPLGTKLRIIEALVEAGVRSLQVASFVNPKRVPQMADVEALLARLPHSRDVDFSGLVLNERGLERLCATGLRHVDLSLSVSDTHGRRNTGMGLAEATGQALAMLRAAKASGLHVRVGLQCVFGCAYEGEIPRPRVLELSRELAAEGCDALSLADSTGHATPRDIKETVEALQAIVDCPLVLHLHDTRGLGIANLIAGYEAGVRAFDAALGGVGGCPFIPGASGNVALEDAVYLFDRMQVATGIALPKLFAATELLECALDHSLPGKLYQLAKRSSAEPSHPLANSEASAWG
jgi:hydroxymethylglutaryl-CoA lyase